MNYSAEKINKYIREGRFDRLVEISESRHILQFEQLYKMVKATYPTGRRRHHTDAILITGPSSSGKTTFASLLAKMFAAEGYCCTMISIDDYYRNRDAIHEMQHGVQETGDYDYETIDAFDIDYFREQMNAYLAGESIVLPKYDFNTGQRTSGGKVLTPSDKDMVIVEGIHAMNPLLHEGIPFTHTLNVYICPFDFYGADGNELVVKPQEIRFMRRAIRDRVHRNSSLERTMEMWPNVRIGEERYIKPMKKFADFFFDSSLEYEIVCLKKRIFDMAEQLDESGLERLNRFIPMDVLAHFDSYDGFAIPENSIFNEFYK